VALSLQAVFDQLSAGGKVVMAFNEVFWSLEAEAVGLKMLMQYRETAPASRALLVVLGAALLAPATSRVADAAAARGRNPRLFAAIEACHPAARSLLQEAVAIDSGTGDAEGLAKVGALFRTRLEALGAKVRAVPSVAPAVGDNFIATLTGTGRGRILLIAHLDTVFPRGTTALHPPRWDGDHLIGPGAGDDKAGAVTALCVLSALQSIRYRNYAHIDLLLNVSEETGSPGSHELILALARDSDLAVNLERGIPGDLALLSRRGNAVLTFEFTGRAAHAGLEPEKGRNAVMEATRVAQALGRLANPDAGTALNVTVLTGGDRPNVIPDRAVLKVDVRAQTAAEFERVAREAAQLATEPAIEGVSIARTSNSTFRPGRWCPRPTRCWRAPTGSTRSSAVR
jgi:glutamate carboxypeptidase